MVSKLRALIAYLSYSGNTQEVAELISEHLVKDNFQVDMHRIGIDPYVDVEKYDYFFFGTFTWDYGCTPEEAKDFILEIGYKPNHVAVFGSGDTQFGGEEDFCKAVDKLVKFYNSRWDGLKIEQSPRGYQEKYIDAWLEGVLQDVKSYA